MNFSVVIPVGPGHEVICNRAQKSVCDASSNLINGDNCEIVLISDVDGHLGRSTARNVGLERAAQKSDWVFLLDADDEMHPNAFEIFYDNIEFISSNKIKALFGSVLINKNIKRTDDSRFISWDLLMNLGARGTLSMGFFINAKDAADHKFLSGMDMAEDFEFYCSFFAKHEIMKVPYPICIIGYDIPPASGPKGYGKKGIKWLEVCDKVVNFWSKRGRVPVTDEFRNSQVYWDSVSSNAR